MPTPRGDRLHQQAAAFMDALAVKEGAAADEMARSWLVVLKRVQIEVDDLMAKMLAAERAGTPVSPAWLYQQNRLGNLVTMIRREAWRWAPYAEQVTADLVADAIRDATYQARALATEAAAVHLAGVTATFATVSAGPLEALVAHLAPGGPLRGLLLGYGTEAASAAQAALLEGVTLGKGSAWTAQQMRQALDIPRWRAETLARTEALRAYREAARATYAASNVVGSWEWLASLDRRCCPGCVGMHGTIHPNTETLDGHPRCRCAMVPRTLTWAQIDPSLIGVPDTQPSLLTGADWLELQPEGTQRAMLGPLKYDAWKAGRITVADMVARTYSPTWGTMRRERSMREILAGRNANTLPSLVAT